MTSAQTVMSIDTDFDMGSDCPPGYDVDSSSSTLRRYHQILWSKKLPDGESLVLEAPARGAYLRARTSHGDLRLASDAIVHSYGNAYKNRIGRLMATVPVRDIETFRARARTIGGYLVFPADTRDRKPTINGARGMHPRIADRIDLTLECIRRHYRGEASPLSMTLARYSDFFALFGRFEAYTAFFLLNDLVDRNGRVKFVLPFDGFSGSALPSSLQEYAQYRARMMEFVGQRNTRIQSWADSTDCASARDTT